MAGIRKMRDVSDCVQNTRGNNLFSKQYAKMFVCDSFSEFAQKIRLKAMGGDSPVMWSYIGASAIFASLSVYFVLMVDYGYIFHRLCALLIPLFSIASSFYCVGFWLRKTWNSTSIYVFFISCIFGEVAAQCLCASSDSYIMKPSMFFIVLLSVSIASLFSPLETLESVTLISLISFVRFLSCTFLMDVPEILRPYLAFGSAICGAILSKYMETTLTPVSPPVSTLPVPREINEMKISMVRRRRSSMVTPQTFASCVGRRTSLPALIQKQVCLVYCVVSI